MRKLPLGQGSGKLVTVKYPKGGYTPGDTWDVYVGSDNRIKEFVYHRGGVTPFRWTAEGLRTVPLSSEAFRS